MSLELFNSRLNPDCHLSMTNSILKTVYSLIINFVNGPGVSVYNTYVASSNYAAQYMV